MKIPALKDDLLYNDVEEVISRIKRKKNTYLIAYRLTKAVVFLLGASITVVTGWKAAGEPDTSVLTKISAQANNYILVVSAAISLLAALEGLFNFKDKGKSYDILLFELRRLRDRICFDFITDPKEYEENKNTRFKEYQMILQSQKSIIESADDDDGK